MKRQFDNQFNSNKKKSIDRGINKDLPIYAFKNELISSIEKYKTTIVVGETGSGKSTQLPQFLLNHFFNEMNDKCIVCTQPRRVAAVTIAQKVASDRCANVGEEVGYSIRFEDKSRKSTKIKYVTDGVLLRESMSDKKLEKYNIIILDEAHERSLQTDILMGLLRNIQECRNDLRVVVMSATLQIDLFSNFFKDSNVVSIPGRQFPVNILYTKVPEADIVDAAMLTCLQIHENEAEGGVLVFLPGQEDIESLQSILEENLPLVIPKNMTKRFKPETKRNNSGSEFFNDFQILPLYAALPPDEQLKVFQPPSVGIRRFILSTNIAETSVTISGIKYVVDSGFVKTRLINPVTGIEMLKVLPVSKSQANQRAGRAGRECPGACYRLFTEESFEKLNESATPEIQRVNIAQVLLQLKVLGIQSIKDFPFISPPSDVALRKAFELLLRLSAFDKNQNLTDHGIKMANLPLDPIYSHLLLKSQDMNCVAECLTIVSLLSSDNVFLQPYKEEDKKSASMAHKVFASRDGDLISLLHIYNSWIKANKDRKWARRNFLSFRTLSNAFSVRQQLSNLLLKNKIDVTSSCYPERDPFLKCLLSSLTLNLAQRVSTIEQAQTFSHKNISTSGGKFNFSKLGNTPSSSMALEDKAPYRTVKGNQPVYIHPSSVLFNLFNSRKLPEFVIFSDLLITSKQYMRNISVIDKSWILELQSNKK